MKRDLKSVWGYRALAHAPIPSGPVAGPTLAEVLWEKHKELTRRVERLEAVIGKQDEARDG